MTSNWWPWTSAEEAEWKLELPEQGESIEERIDHMVSDGLACSSYDPLQPQEDFSDEEVSAG
jgi:hypothetical protein